MIALEKFVLAGNATFTAVSKKTGTRFTFKVTKFDPNRPHSVALLNGPDNENSYCYLGTIFDESNYRHGKKARVGMDAPSAKAFEYIWAHRNDPALPEKVEIHHEGKCCCCGKKLTTPESVTTGIGPVCAGRKGW